MRHYLIMISLVLLFVGCKKEEITVATRLQIKSVDFFSGDTVSNVPFDIARSSDGVAVQSDSTNSYGNYNGCLVHKETQPLLVRTSDPRFYQVGELGLISGETNNGLLEVIETADLQFAYDCSGPGSGILGSVQRYMLNALPSELAYAEPGMTRVVNSQACGDTSTAVTVFPGNWVINYQWKPNVVSGYTVISDTIEIPAGQDYIYTIVY